ncbi:hypothetical protein AALC17_01675 [Oscillospiraceae bacterium 38-13]
MANSTADGSVIIDVDMNVSQAEKRLGKLRGDVKKTEKELADMARARDEAKEKSLFQSAELDAEKAKLQEIKDRLEKIRSLSKDKGISVDNRETYAANIPAVKQELDEQKFRVRALESEWNKTENSVDSYNRKIDASSKKLDKLKTEAGILTQEIDEATKKQNGFAKAAGAAGEAKGRLSSRIMELVKSAFIFNVISRGLTSLQQMTMKYIQTNDEARQAIAQLKGALLTLAQPLIEILIPAFTLLVNILTQIISAAAQLVSTLFGKTVQQSKDGAKALYKEANAIGAVGAAADEAAGSLAGFDEIDPINTESAKGAGGGGAAGGEIAPDFSGLIGGELDKITALVGAALLAIGAILAFSGANIPLGIALMAAGAVTLVSAIHENWGAISEELRGPIGLITALVSTALLALGALLLFSGVNIPLGLALIAAGALGLAAVVAANWGTLSDVLSGPIGAVTAAASTALLAIGALLAFSGVNIPLGLALMAAGAVGLVASIAANWDSVQQALEGPTGAVTGLISGLLLTLGAILLFSGANIPLGLGLLAVGAIGLSSSIAANWETIQTTLQGPVGTITAMVSGALLVLGAILAFSGAALPLGIGLMVAGAVGLVTAIAANWETVQNALGGPISAVTAIVSGALLVLGIILLFTGAGVALGLGLIAAGAVGLAATAAPNWDFVLDAIKGAWTNVKNWWGANAEKYLTFEYWKDRGKDMIDGLLKGLAGIFSGLRSWASNVWNTITGSFSDKNAKNSVTQSVRRNTAPSNGWQAVIPSIPEAKIPRLAKGAVIPPNREFMAVLGDQRSGTNIEAPEELLRKIAREESSVGNESVVTLLEALLEAVKDGHIIMVDGSVFGRTAIRTINNITTATGRQQLKL